MSPTISQVRHWTLSDLTHSATGLRSGAQKMSDGALTILNGLAGIDTDWAGEGRDAAVVRSKDGIDSLQRRAQRWNSAATVLDEADQQLSLLRDALLQRVDDHDNQRMFVIADDGNVELRDDFANTLTDKLERDRVEQIRADTETALRSLLATLEVCATVYDGKTTAALVGTTEWPYSQPQIPDPTALPTRPKERSNLDGSGPDQYNIDKLGWNEKLGLQSIKIGAENGAAAAELAGMDQASKLLQHFLGGSGTTATVPVDDMFKTMPWFNQAAQGQTRSTLTTAINVMPSGYTGPVAFQSDYSAIKPDGTPARPDPKSNTDWFAALGTFSYQSSGIATPTDEGSYSVAARTSIYDYYNFETTDRHWWPQASDLNDLHRAGWAQNFDTTGTSTIQHSTYP